MAIVGCGSPKPEEPTLPPASNPSAQPSVSQTAERQPANAAELKDKIDLAEYPGAEQVESHRLVSANLAPDEARFELVRRTKDAPDKVVKFFEDQLGEKAFGSAGHKEIFGRTKRGNDVKALINDEDGGTKFTLIIISYAKK